MTSLGVHHEWGALKEVCVGNADIFVPANPMRYAVVRDYLTPAAQEFLVSHTGHLKDSDPDLYERCQREQQDVVAILESRGISVHRIPEVTKAEAAFEADLMEGYFPTSMRDPILVINNNYIELSLSLPLRRQERFGLRRVLGDKLAGPENKVVSMPQPEPVPYSDQAGWGPGPFLEGGDVFVLGQDIYIGNSGLASNSAGIAWLQQYLGSDYRVHEIRLNGEWLHLDCVLATLRQGLALVVASAFTDGLPEFLADWELIGVTEEDAHNNLACNGLIIDDHTMMIDDRIPHIASKLRGAGIEAIETPLTVNSMFGGGLRCFHHPLVRESEALWRTSTPESHIAA